MDLDTQAILELAPGTTERLYFVPQSNAGFRFKITPRQGAFQAKAYALAPEATAPPREPRNAPSSAATYHPTPLTDSITTVEGSDTQTLQSFPVTVSGSVVVLELTNPGTLPLNLTVVARRG